MGWADCGKDSHGRKIGYAISETCDHPKCKKKINRGLSYACGGMHGAGEYMCEGYFCLDHLYYHRMDEPRFPICERCLKESESPDSEDNNQ